MYIVLSIIFIAVGAVMLIRPKIFFELTESWKSSTSGEPSRLYLFSTRFGGIMFLLVGAVGLVVLFFVN